MHDNGKRRKKKSEPSVVFNLGSSGGANVALEKDAMLADAIEAEQKSRKDKCRGKSQRQTHH